MPLTLYPLAKIRTHNTKENPAEKIGQLWQNNFTKLPQNEPYYGVYLNYESDFTGYYDVAVAVGVNRASDSNRVHFKMSGSATTSGDYAVGAGMGYQW